jgi:hypothetical protein
MVGLDIVRGQVQRFIELIRNFAQHDLGCDCSEDVFEQVKILTGEATPGVTDLGIVIGERLFVGFVPIDVVRPVDTLGHKLVISAVAYRDSMKLNRVRLVFEGNVSDEEKLFFEIEAEKHDKVHMHYFEEAS